MADEAMGDRAKKPLNRSEESGSSACVRAGSGVFR